MATSNKLKAWVRYDGQKKIVPSSLILQAHKPKVGTWKEIPTDLCCQPAPNALRLFFADIDDANLIVGDVTNVDDWNSFFDLPAFGNPFKSVTVINDEVRLFGGSDITLKYLLFGGLTTIPRNSLIKIIDDAGCVIIIEDAAFEGCGTLREVRFPEVTETTYVNYYGAFGDCSNLKTAYLPKLRQLGPSGPFYGCYRLQNLTLAFDEITQLGDGAFDGCYSLIGTVSYPNLLYTGISTFQLCGYDAMNLPSLIAAGDYAFVLMNNLQSISLPSLTYLGVGAFYNSALQTIDAPVLNLIMQNAFQSCASLTNVNIPSCTDLGGSVGNNNVFQGITGNTITLTVPAALMTCNAGQPDGDIQYLQANNTVTVITV